jgi:signal transduction histidine kinase
MSPDRPAPQLPHAGRGAACWEFDCTEAWALLDTSVTKGGPGWAREGLERFLARVRVLGVSNAALLLFDLPWDRARMTARPLGSLWPEPGLTALADLLASLANATADSLLTRRIDRIDRLTDVELTGWRPSDAREPGLVNVVIQATLDTREALLADPGPRLPRSLGASLPVPLWDVDARAARRVFDRLRADGVTDLDEHLRRRPDLVDIACEIVVVTEANRDAVELMGAADATELQRPVDYLFSIARETARRVMLANFAGERNHVEQTKIRTLDGRVRDVLLLVTFPVPGEQLDTTLVMMLDNTAALEAEARLRQMEADFSHAARLSTLGQMTASIAHEIKQPLSAILTNAETSLRWLAKADPNLPKVTQLAERIAASAQRATDIIARIQDMAGKREPRHSRLDLNDVIREALNFVRHDAEERSIRVRLDLAEDLPSTLGDRIQLQQVVVNLLVNAAQALEALAPDAREIQVATYRDSAGSVAFSIRDSGPGIPAEHLERIFSGFFSTKAGGMGIGLTICQSIVAAHGGAIAAVKPAGPGAEFRVVLPVEPAEGEGPAEPALALTSPTATA